MKRFHQDSQRMRLPLKALLLLASACVLLACARKNEPAAAAPTAPPAVHYEAHVQAGGAPPPGGSLSNPHRGDAAVAKQGALVFASMNCDGCHGGDASGFIGPNLGDGRWRYGGADAEVFNSIYYGRPKGMPAFGGMLGTEGVWMLVTYLKSLPLPDDVPTESWVEKDK
ncbi:MAG TPA: c-type cytochrome [Steroidobacteraceae bacterium]|jgi:cytochrome c oxidase cbb3-type subunit 3|nr:c-type cytochrome [Steroidobacteraceae bacterium]